MLEPEDPLSGSRTGSPPEGAGNAGLSAPIPARDSDEALR
ncbi:MAG: hypothetical protein AVDCRST_MAG02-2007 [uncultured Rubrobacteraceae bacterium]|uniref:Uncharacterized protein n=1 Tax=uncultured Rubrobacteraceae bacterium TaxID=349277 RepID=A0A6J4QZ39_9ACTN|nr:MAG: hypothetical protein AVDCRST_MAG02-2007 [uncultured Rubrobacteraceae bacterium]